MKEAKYFNSRVINDLSTFKNSCSMILANRYHNDLKDVAKKVFTRDIFGDN